jgi:hypothetical protein
MTKDPSPEHVHVWKIDEFPGFEIKSCDCGEMKIEDSGSAS